MVGFKFEIFDFLTKLYLIKKFCRGQYDTRQQDTAWYDTRQQDTAWYDTRQQETARYDTRQQDTGQTKVANIAHYRVPGSIPRGVNVLIFKFFVESQFFYFFYTGLELPTQNFFVNNDFFLISRLLNFTSTFPTTINLKKFFSVTNFFIYLASHRSQFFFSSTPTIFHIDYPNSDLEFFFYRYQFFSPLLTYSFSHQFPNFHIFLSIPNGSRILKSENYF